jgi:ribosomal protein S18 acetylase RimI-like enzyme
VDDLIRRAEPADIDRLYTILTPEDGEYFAGCMAYQRGDGDEPDGREPSGEVLLAMLDGEPIGALFVRWTGADEPEVVKHLPQVPMLYHVVIKDGLRGAGHGSRFLRAVGERLRRRGYERVALGIDHSNTRARRVYERLGYELSENPELRGLRAALTPDEDGKPDDGEPYDILVAELRPAAMKRRS